MHVIYKICQGKDGDNDDGGGDGDDEKEVIWNETISKHCQVLAISYRIRAKSGKRDTRPGLELCISRK